MKFETFTFKDSRYVYKGEAYYSICKAFDSHTEEYKNLPDNEKEKYIEDKTIEVCVATMIGNIVRKLEAEYDSSSCLFDRHYVFSLLKVTMKNFPLELYKNIVEWINDEPLSDIDYCDLTMNEIVKALDFPAKDNWSLEEKYYRPYKAENFIRAIRVMSHYADNKFSSKKAALDFAEIGFNYQ